MRYLVVLMLLLAGCASVRSQPLSEEGKWQAFETFSEELTKKRDAKEITYREAALAALAKVREIDLQEPLLVEFLSYEVLLAGRAERGEITGDEARYLSAKNKRELLERAEAADRAASTASSQAPTLVPVPVPMQAPVYIPRPAQQPVPRPAYTSPVPPQIRCRPDGIGGVICR